MGGYGGHACKSQVYLNSISTKIKQTIVSNLSDETRHDYFGKNHFIGSLVSVFTHELMILITVLSTYSLSNFCLKLCEGEADAIKQ